MHLVSRRGAFSLCGLGVVRPTEKWGVARGASVVTRAGGWPANWCMNGCSSPRQDKRGKPRPTATTTRTTVDELRPWRVGDGGGGGEGAASGHDTSKCSDHNAQSTSASSTLAWINRRSDPGAPGSGCKARKEEPREHGGDQWAKKNKKKRDGGMGTNHVRAKRPLLTMVPGHRSAAAAHSGGGCYPVEQRLQGQKGTPAQANLQHRCARGPSRGIRRRRGAVQAVEAPLGRLDEW